MVIGWSNWISVVRKQSCMGTQCILCDVLYTDSSVRIPLRTVTATMYTEGVFQLDQTMPVRSLTASMGVTADVMSVASKIPGALLLAGSMYEGDAFQLDAIIPQRTMAGAMWSDVWWLNEEIPVWLIDSLMLDTKPSVHPDLDITEDSFSGVLRYVRP